MASTVICLRSTVMPLACESLCQVGGGDRTEELALFGLDGQRQRQVGDRLGQRLGVGQNLGVLVGALAEVLCEDLLRGSRGGLRITLRDQVVVRITGLHVHDVVGVAQLLHIFDQNYFHGRLSLNYFMQIGYEGQNGPDDGRLHGLCHLLLELLRGFLSGGGAESCPAR